MQKKTHGLKPGMITGLSLIIVLSAINAFAWGGFRGGRYHYNHGFYHGYYHNHFGWGFHGPYLYDYNYDYNVVAPPIGGFVAYLPLGYTTVIVSGTPYYYCAGYYFRPYSSGYVIVPAPVVNKTAAAASEEPKTASKVTAQPEPASNDTTTINIPNSKGEFTPVRLVKHNNGYLGPQGEFYAGHPTVEQLKALYGN
jgi:hypothetical protein